MKNLNLEEDIKHEVYQSLEAGFGIYDLIFVYGKNSLRIRIFLDKYSDPWGTPTISDCSKFSRKCDAKLMDLVEKGKMSDQYTIEVSSPGAERELKSLEDWIRFQDKPMKVRYKISQDKFETIVAKFLRSETDKIYWKKIATKKDRKNKTKVKETEVGINLQDISQVRLYLEF